MLVSPSHYCPQDKDPSLPHGSRVLVTWALPASFIPVLEFELSWTTWLPCVHPDRKWGWLWVCYCGEATKGSVRTAQRKMDIGQFHWLSAKRSYLHFCSQTIDPWDILMISAEFRLGHLMCPLYVMPFSRGNGGKEGWRGYTTPVPLASPCTCLSLLQSGAVSPCTDRTPFSDIPDPTELSLPSSLLGTKLNDGRIFLFFIFL